MAQAASLPASLLLYFLLLCVSLVVVAYTMATEEDLSPAGDLIATATFSALIAMFAVKYRRSLAPLLTHAGRARYYFIAVAASVVTFLMASGVVTALEMLGMESLRYSDTFVEEGWGWWAPVLSIAVLPALFEEIAFRGLLSQSLNRYLTAREAIGVSAGLFAVLHLSVFSVPHLLVMGIVLSLLCRRSGSLYPAMLLHFCHNGLVVVVEQWEALRPW